jgi:MFS family permease
MDTIGAILGPLVAYLILRAVPTGFNLVFSAAFIAGLFAIATLFFVKEVSGAIQSKKLNLKNWSAFSPKFKNYLFSVAILSVGTLPISILLLKTADLGLMLASIPLYYMISNIAFAIFSIIAGKYADRFGAGKIIVGGYLFLILSYLVLMWTDGLSTLIFGFILVGLFYALTDGIHRSYAAHLTEETNRASAYGWLNGLSGLGALFAGVLGGYLWQTIGDGKTLLFGALIVVIGLLFFLFSQFRKN